MIEFKYIVVSRKHWSSEELDELNSQFSNVAKFIFGD